jgi:hypothetical protein
MLAGDRMARLLLFTRSGDRVYATLAGPPERLIRELKRRENEFAGEWVEVTGLRRVTSHSMQAFIRYDEIIAAQVVGEGDRDDSAAHEGDLVMLEGGNEGGMPASDDG